VLNIFSPEVFIRNRDNAFGVANIYGLDGPGFEFWQWKKVLSSPEPSTQALEPKGHPTQWVKGFFLGGKASGE
jgi:hypothetical protein